jgi:hypothetical protein
VSKTTLTCPSWQLRGLQTTGVESLWTGFCFFLGQPAKFDKIFFFFEWAQRIVIRRVVSPRIGASRCGWVQAKEVETFEDVGAETLGASKFVCCLFVCLLVRWVSKAGD